MLYCILFFMNILIKEKKKNELISLYKKYKSLTKIAINQGISRQAISALFKRYKININEYRESSILLGNIQNYPAIYSLFFIDEPTIKYYGSTEKIKKRMYHHIYLLKRNKHYSLSFQQAFNKYGINSLKLKIIKKINPDKYLKEELLYEEKKYIENNKNCFNKYLLLSDDEKNIKIQIKDSDRYNKSKTLPNKKSKYKGLTWCKHSQSWKIQPYIRNENKQVHLGYHKDEEEAKKIIDIFLSK